MKTAVRKDSPDEIAIKNTARQTAWSPKVGRELEALLRRKRLSHGDSIRLESETSRILSKCVPPLGGVEQRTGLVIGYVQSGKTLSFTAVTALARDNGYKLVIVLGGTTTNLVEQSDSRLLNDLDINGEGQRVWMTFANPDARAETAEDINRALRSWRAYPGRLERCPTTLIVVMKNHQHIRKLEALLKRCDLADVSALVIDDEGDQAGLNNKIRQKAESTTYQCIRLLREVLPCHTYLLYTATPQAPLLISRIDMLSPQFADPIEPGEAYVGGKDIFVPGSPYIEGIPENELPDDDSADGLPNSLEKALRLFFVGVAAGCVASELGNRSMMIHPSQLRDWHKKFVTWVRSTKSSWLGVLRDSVKSPDRQQLIAEFRAAYSDLSNTELSLPPFERIEADLEYAIDQTQIKEVNARVGGRIPTVKWKQNYSFILVGGTGLDRGFTVEGLTVTYMPRGAGTGNADTVQQRGRFFGYKRSYVGLIRIFLEHSVEQSFRQYVEHEKSIRQSLIAFRDTGKPLSEWRRAFFLDRKMSPTRSSVLSLDYMRGRSREWIIQRRPNLESDVLDRNRSVIARFVKEYEDVFIEDDGDQRRNDDQRHLVATDLRLEQVYKELLVPLTMVGDDLLDHLHVLLQIERELEEHRDAPCDVYQMKKGRLRERSIDKDGAIKNLMQGANERTAYPGDRHIRSNDRVTVQIHTLKIKDESKKTDVEKVKIVTEGVPVLAVGIPESMRRDAFMEESDATS